jgi:transcriptional regulator of acetoin/glycerol metabolism
MRQWRFPDGPAATQVAMRSRWETFQRAGAIAEGVRPEIACSWQRAAQANLQPALRAAPVDVAALGGFDDAGPGRRRFVDTAGRVAGELAAELDDAAAAAIVVCDAGGLVLHRTGPAQVLALMEEYNLVPGGVWNELGVGTTAVGLALATGGPAHVYAAEHFADDRPPTVIWGEPGTGKLMLAEHLHRIGGGGPLTLVACASDAWEAKLDRAAALGETAVLRRLHALAPAAQLQLCDRLDALTEAGVMPWLIALANPQACRPQEELLSRLGGASLVLPPLRDRPADIRPLVEHWCATRERRFGTRPALSAGAWELVLGYAWPGNERELMSTLDAASRRGGPVIGGKSLQLRPALFPSATLRDIERAAIETALQRTGGNVSQAARGLGIGRATLHRRLRDYRLTDSRITVDG